MLKLKSSAKTSNRYLLINGNKDDVEKTILDYIGILGFAKANPRFIKSKNGDLILAIDRKMINEIRGAVAIASDKIRVLKISGTLKGLKEKRKKMNRRTLTIILSLAIILIALLIVLINFTPSNARYCTEEAKICPDGSFVVRNPDLNCEFDKCPGDGEGLPQNFCPQESRNVEACIAIYQPVCGWFNPEKIQCIKYPCAQTFSSSCVACMNEDVLYWTDGECPE